MYRRGNGGHVWRGGMIEQIAQLAKQPAAVFAEHAAHGLACVRMGKGRAQRRADRATGQPAEGGNSGTLGALAVKKSDGGLVMLTRKLAVFVPVLEIGKSP